MSNLFIFRRSDDSMHRFFLAKEEREQFQTNMSFYIKISDFLKISQSRLELYFRKDFLCRQEALTKPLTEKDIYIDVEVRENFLMEFLQRVGMVFYFGFLFGVGHFAALIFVNKVFPNKLNILSVK